MDLQLPHPIEKYLRAENAGDVEALSQCFTPYATVRDEGHYYEGLPAIKNWKTRVEEEIQPHGYASGDQHVEWKFDSQSPAHRDVCW